MQAQLRFQHAVAPPAEQREQGGGAPVVAQGATLAGRPEQPSGERPVGPDVSEPGRAAMIEREQIGTGTVADQVGTKLDLAALTRRGVSPDVGHEGVAEV